MKRFNESIPFVTFVVLVILMNSSPEAYGNSKEKKDKEACIIKKDGAACYRLGILLSEQNPIIGKKWYKLGCKLGHSESCAEFEELKRSPVEQQDHEFDENIKNKFNQVLNEAKAISSDNGQELPERTGDAIDHIMDEAEEMMEGKSLEEMERINEILEEERTKAEQKNSHFKKRLEAMIDQESDQPLSREKANEMIEEMEKEYTESYGEDL